MSAGDCCGAIREALRKVTAEVTVRGTLWTEGICRNGIIGLASYVCPEGCVITPQEPRPPGCSPEGARTGNRETQDLGADNAQLDAAPVQREAHRRVTLG